MFAIVTRTEVSEFLFMLLLGTAVYISFRVGKYRSTRTEIVRRTSKFCIFHHKFLFAKIVHRIDNDNDDRNIVKLIYLTPVSTVNLIILIYKISISQHLRNRNLFQDQFLKKPCKKHLLFVKIQKLLYNVTF